MTLGEKILELRRRNGMSQDVLAEQLEVSRQAVSKWERDEAVPETDKIIRIAQLFSVSTDYLLMDTQEPARQPQPQNQPPQSRSVGDRIERFIRRHGYKSGYVLIGIGAFLCVIALLVMILMPKFGSGMFDPVDSFGSNWGSNIYVEGNVDQEILDAIYDQVGSNGFFDSFDQQVSQMESSWRSGVSILVALVTVPVLLFAGVLIVLGSVIVVKGKKLAQTT